MAGQRWQLAGSFVWFTILATIAAPAATEEECRNFVEQRSASDDRPDLYVQAIKALPDGCRFDKARLDLTPAVSWVAESLFIEISDFNFAAGQFPSRMRAEADNARIILTGAGPAASYAALRGSSPIDFILDYEFSQANRSLRVHRLSVGNPRLGRLELSGEFVGAPEETVGGFRRFEMLAVGLKSLDLDLDNSGLFESYALPHLAGAFVGPDSSNPIEDVELSKSYWREVIGKLLREANTDTEAMAAIDGFIADFPNPDKRLRMRLQFSRYFTVFDSYTFLDGEKPIEWKSGLAALRATYR